MIGKTVSHYVILERVGAGGMGVVYKAEDTRLGRFVALKFLPEELSRDRLAVERFQREARAASALNHPHICSVYDIGEHDGRHFIVMEFLEGTPVDHLLGGHALAADEIVELGIQITDALDAAHEKGLVHRDIKPANIFRTRRGQAKLLDFGLAKPTSEQGPLRGQVELPPGPTQENLTNPGAVLGTVAYMSPEQVRGEPLDARTDIFSLGAVLYEMATGRRAFPGDTSGVISEAVLNRSPLPAGRVNTDLPPGLEAILDKALEKDRDLRYQKASDLRADLQRLKRDSGPAREAARSGVVSADAVKPWWRRPTTLAAAGFVLAALAVASHRFDVFSTRAGAIDSIAVLPFANGTGDGNAEYLSDGITESIINNLSQVPSLRVTARSTVFRYKGKDADPRTVGQELRVGAVLSGRLLQRGDTLIVRTELTDVVNGSQLWGGQYNRPVADVFALQEDVSREISEKLRLRLTPEQRERMTKRYTGNAEAYQLYLKGRFHWNKRSPDAVQRAIEYFQQAVENDPAYALAYAGLADGYNMLSFFNVVPPREAMSRAKAAAEKALEIDDDLAEAHVSLGWASFTYDWDWPAATRHFERAMTLNAASVMSHGFYPFYLVVGGRSQEAVSVARRALDADPTSPALSHNLSVALVLTRQFDEAIAECRRTIEMDPTYGVAHEVLGASYAAKGMFREALRSIERASALSPGNAISLALLGYVHASVGNRSQALRTVEDLRAASKQRYVPALSLAIVYVGLGEKDQAFAWLEKAFEERFNRLAYLRREPVWDRLRSDPRFDDLLRRIGMPP